MIVAATAPAVVVMVIVLTFVIVVVIVHVFHILTFPVRSSWRGAYSGLPF